MTREQLINAFLNGTQYEQGRNALSIRNGALYSYNENREHVTNYGDKVGQV